MLSGGEIARLYARDFLIVDAAPVWRSNDEELKKLPRYRYVPNFVFLDSSGAKILETRGFNNPTEARALHEYVSRKLYKSTSLADFLATYPGQ